MGLLVDGEWRDQWYDTKSTGGKFVRAQSAFRNWITSDGEPGPTGQGGFKAEPGRYHLYVSLACPWAHRTLIFRQLKGLQDFISVSVVHPHMMEQGWGFGTWPGAISDPIHNARYMHQIYTAAQGDYTGRVTVPILWDKQRATIVNNESAEIIRMFNQAFNPLTGNTLDFYPQDLRTEIDRINDRVYSDVNNGVYKTGFATTQEAYEEAFHHLFKALDWLEDLLKDRRYVTGPAVTEADWRLFTTLVRFDPVYFGHFKCNLRQIADYPNLSQYLRDLYQQPGVAETVNMDHIKQHYYYSHQTINPTRVVPLGPEQDLTIPHSRAEMEI